MNTKIKKVLCPLSIVFFMCTVATAGGRTGTQVFPLDGTWEVTGWNSDKTQSVTLDGTVPGQIHPDLHKAGLIPDPFWRDNAEKCQWPEYWYWNYKKTFDKPENLSDDWLVLQFDGIDTYADIYLNGRKLGMDNGYPTTVQDMFIPYEFEIGGWLKERDNVLEVRFKPIEEMVGEQAKQKAFDGAFSDPYRPYVRRMQCTFGWDWVPRFVTYGIWRSCRIVSYPKARVDNIFVYTKSIGDNSADMHLEVESTIKDQAAASLEIVMTDRNTGEVWSGKVSTPSAKHSYDFRLDAPDLWWPVGYGEQPLYFVKATLRDKSGNVLDEKIVETGIRTVSIEEKADKQGPGSSFTMVVNGKRIYAKGGNWVPADPFPSRITSEKYWQLLSQFSDANMNMLRIWGGGIFEPEVFWQACNRLGILVSQDFLMACSGYPEDDPKFVELFKRELLAQVPAIRNNPSLAFWCGDNELGLGYKLNEDWPAKKMHANMTAPLMKTLDPSRDFRLTSPLGHDPETTNSIISGDSHINAFLSGEICTPGYDFATYRDIISKYSAGRFMSEHVTFGSPPKKILQRFMTDKDIEGRDIYEYHTRDNPYTAGNNTLFSHVEYCAGKLYGDPQDDNDRRIRQLEYIQYDFVRLGMEGSRRRKFYSSGLQVWMYNDCWPAIGWSLIDYWGNRKAGWYAMASAAKPVIAASENTGKEINWWVCNDTFEDISVDVVVSIQPTRGEAVWSETIKVQVPANAVEKAIALPLSDVVSKLGNDALLVCSVKYAGGSDRSYWTPAEPCKVNYPPADLRVVSEKRDKGHGEIIVRSDNWARVVTFDAPEVDFEDNYFELLPGEERTIKWKARSPYFASPIGISCWNQAE